MKSKKNNLIIIGLCSILVLMGIGYAAFSSQLNITGTSNITSTWDVRITNIESELHGAEDIEEPSYDNTNGLYASFSTGLKRPGDYALYTVTIENRGSVDARIEKINTYYKENKYITFTLSGLTKGDVIKGKETKELQVKVEFNSDVTSIEENISVDLDISIDVAQDSDNPLPANDYYVTYDYQTNGGESSNAVNDYVTEGSNVNLEYTATKAGYEFIGWNTDKGAVTGLDSYSMPSNNVTLYAIFRKIDTTPPVIDNVSTTSTTNSITVVTTASDDMGEITKYEYSIDNGSYVEGESTYTFTGLTQNTSHTVKVRVTNEEGLTAESEAKTVQTNILNVPTFSEEETDSGKTVTITYPEGEGLTYEYQKDSGEWQTATQSQKVEFTESGTLVARVSDGINTVNTSTYAVEIGISVGGINLPIVETGDGLYEDKYENNKFIYRGINPNNHVTFNNELWRIISIDTNDGTIKIMRNDVLTDKMSYDEQSVRYSDYCSTASGCNAWGSNSTTLNSEGQVTDVMIRNYDDTKLYALPTQEASLNVYLNNTYFNSLNNNSKAMIVDGIFNIGPIYEDYENGIQTFETDIKQAKSYLWRGKVGLVDVIEYVKASTNELCDSVYDYGRNTQCYNNSNNYMKLNVNWFWLLNPSFIKSNDIVRASRSWMAGSSSIIDSPPSSASVNYVRPVVTLSPEVKITGGDGSSTNSYQLSL